MKYTDTEMLDWIENQGSKYYGWQVQTPKDAPFVKGCFFLDRNVMCKSASKTAREAIQEAMERA